MSNSNNYDIVIAGGGLAGLSCAILLSRRKYRVLVLEKEDYPRHKVCGEYISMESRPFLENLGLPLGILSLPTINKLLVTDSRNNFVNAKLKQGGFGISRYMLDSLLAELAMKVGVTLQTKTKVENIEFDNEQFTVLASSETFTAKIVCGTWGKRGNMDIKLNRPFAGKKTDKLINFIGVKYHIRYPWQQDVIGLHNFSNGYCGISQIEDGKCCLCYLTTAKSLNEHGNSIDRLEQEVLMKNKWLHKIFNEAQFLYDEPLTISQISFDKKEQVYEHMLMLGDTAGLISPLCGNGMSMAFHAAKIAAEEIDGFLKGDISRMIMENNYIARWNKEFSNRLAIGR